MRWHYRDPALLWLFVPAYALHLVEEFWGGFPQWIARVAGEPLPPAAFLSINAAAMAVLVLAIRAATSSERAGWLAVAIGTAAGTNAIAHLGGSMLTGIYSPGLLTGIVIYVPLSLLTLTRAVRQAPPTAFGRGVAVGIVVNVVVFIVASATARLT